MMLAILTLLAAPITFAAPAAKLDKVLERLEASTGIVWRADPEMARRVVFVSVSDVAPADLQARLSEATGGRWREHDGALTLEPDPEAERLRREAILAARRAGIERLFAEYRKVLERPFDAAEAGDLMDQLVRLDQTPREPGEDPVFSRRQATLFMRGPCSRAMLRLVLGLSVDELAALGPRSRTVFAPDPTRMQRPLGQDAGPVVDEYLREQAVWAAEMDVRPWRRPEMLMGGDPRGEPPPLEERPNLYLVVWGGEGASLFHVELMAQVEGMEPFALTQLSASAEEIWPEPEPQGLERIPAAAIEWSPAAQALLEASKEGQERLAPLGPAARPIVLDPVTHEPADAVIGDALRAWARAGYDVVAALPDAAIGAFLREDRRVRRAATVREYLGPLFAQDLLDLRTDARWAVLTPGSSNRVAVSNLDREALRELARSVDSHTPTLDALASYMWRARGHDHEFGLALASLLDRGLYWTYQRSTFPGPRDEGLQLYGSLSRAQRTILETGGTIMIGALTSEQREVAHRIAYFDLVRSPWMRPDGVSVHAGEPPEPTRAFPNGLPANGHLSLRTNREDVLTAYRRQEDGSWLAVGPESPSSVGWALAVQAADGEPGDPDARIFDGYAVTPHELLHLRVHFDAEHWQAPRLVRLLPPTGEPVPWTELPEAMKSEIEESRRMAEILRGHRTGAAPP
jgi:hypothetical protein